MNQTSFDLQIFTNGNLNENTGRRSTKLETNRLIGRCCTACYTTWPSLRNMKSSGKRNCFSSSNVELTEAAYYFLM